MPEELDKVAQRATHFEDKAVDEYHSKGVANWATPELNDFLRTVVGDAYLAGYEDAKPRRKAPKEVMQHMAKVAATWCPRAEEE